MPKSEVLLYDDVNRWTYQSPTQANPTFYQNTKNAERQMLRYRVQIRHAQRFYLADDFVKASMAASVDFDNVKKWTNIARLPYSRTWLEFDNQVKLKWAYESGFLLKTDAESFGRISENGSKRMGLLLETLNEETGAWACTAFIDDPDGLSDVDTIPICFFLAPEGPSLSIMRPPAPWDNSFNGYSHPSRMTAFAHIGLGIRSPKQGEAFGIDPEFENRIQITCEPLFCESMDQAIGRLSAPAEKLRLAKRFACVASDAASENAGIFRWLITVLSMMNQVPIVKHYYAPQHGHRMKRGKLVPYLDHNVISLKLPKTKPIPHIIHALNHQSDERRRNRAHMVRGHFRTMERGNAIRCRHEPTMVENGVGICLRCEQMIKWKPEFARGDASLGWVNHDYHVEAS